MDRIIYLKDDSDEGIKVLTERRIQNFNSLKEEKQGEEGWNQEKITSPPRGGKPPLWFRLRKDRRK